MIKSHIQLSTRFSKINHPYYFVESVARKDYAGICRHFLWQTNRQNNQPLTQKSIVSTIAELTEYGGIDSRSLTNSLVIMAKHGEIERYKGITNRIGWNPDVTNQVKWTRFNSTYSGNSIRTYNEDEANAITKLLKLSNSAPFMPRDIEDLNHTIEIEENDMLKEEIRDLKDEVSSLRETVNALRSFCEQKFKAIEIENWFREHGSLELIKS